VRQGKADHVALKTCVFEIQAQQEDIVPGNHDEPIKYFLLLLCSYTLKLEQEIKKLRLIDWVSKRRTLSDAACLWLLETGVYAWFEVSEVTEHAFLKLFQHGGLDRPSKRFKTRCT
jgi:hypothetical protein